MEIGILQQDSQYRFKTRKDFAAVVTTTKYPAFFFSYYDKKVSSPLEWLWSFPNDKVIELLDRLPKMVTISFEIDEELFNGVQKLCSEIGTTVEQLLIDFLKFCAKPENYETVKKWLTEEWVK